MVTAVCLSALCVHVTTLFVRWSSANECNWSEWTSKTGSCLCCQQQPANGDSFCIRNDDGKCHVYTPYSPCALSPGLPSAWPVYTALSPGLPSAWPVYSALGPGLPFAWPVYTALSPGLPSAWPLIQATIPWSPCDVPHHAPPAGIHAGHHAYVVVIHVMLQLVSVVFSSVTSEISLFEVLGGNTDDPSCSSFGGSCRRLWPSNEFPGEVFFPDINPSIRDPNKPVTGALVLVSNDGDERCKWASIMQPGANFYCHLCKVHRKHTSKYQYAIIGPCDAPAMPLLRLLGHYDAHAVIPQSL